MELVMRESFCSCGEVEDHVVGRGRTADGKRVDLWSDGGLSWALGYAVRGSARPRTNEQRRLALVAGWLVLGDIELYRADQVSALVRAARWAAARDGLPATMRRRFHGGSR